MVFDSFFFLFLPYFYFFIKIIITSHRKGGLSQSPKPDSSPSYNLPLLGHGLGCYPKNPLTSEIEVSSVSYEQIRVVIFLKCFDSFFSFFNTPCHPEFDSGSHFYFFKIVFDSFFFLFLLCFYFFIKIIITSLRGRNQLGVRSPQF